MLLQSFVIVSNIPRHFLDKDTYIFTWVGLASTPRLLSSKQNCHAVRPRELVLSSITTALNSPRPRTSLTRGECSARISFRNCSPSRSARSARPSSTSTSNAVIATAQPSGFLSKVACACENMRGERMERRRTRRRYYHARQVGHRASRPYRQARRIRDIHPRRELFQEGPHLGECLRAPHTTSCQSDKGPNQTQKFSTVIMSQICLTV